MNIHQVLNKINEYNAERLFQELTLEQVINTWLFAHKSPILDKHDKFKAQGVLAKIHRDLSEMLCNEKT